MYIISFFDRKTICNLECVSKNWIFSKSSNHNLFWKSFSKDFIEYHNKYYDKIIEIDEIDSNGFKDALKKTFYEQMKLMENYNPQTLNHKYIGSKILKFCYENIKLPPPERKYPSGYEIPSTNELKFVMIGDSAAGKTCKIIYDIKIIH